MRFKGAIFDLDGTLVDSLPSIAAAVNHGLTQLELPTHAQSAVGRMVGEGVRTLCERALPDSRPELLEDLLRHVWSYYEAHLLDRTKPYAGIDAMVRELAGAGARLGVLSNKPDVLTCRTIAGLSWSPWFKAVRGQIDGVPKKPDPAGAFWVLGGLGLEPNQTLYVGDTAIDMRTAKAAGMASVAVTWGFRMREELERESPTWIVDDPAEIIEIASR
ncbi:MAG: HAD family hydrolase [Planctomycetes bacterium]|nr:HAD family hydrolase [Planctomycetota bacterium]MCC7169098.1 HAD family hydrolase [Planctomycetota bacterium]